MSNSSLTVILPEKCGNPLYFTEILKQRGFFIELIDPKKIKQAILGSNSIKLIVIVGPIIITGEDMKVIKDWVQKGGGLLAVGNVMGLEDVLGGCFIPINEGRFQFPVGGTKNNSLGEGYLHPCSSDPESIDFFKGSKPIYFPLHGFGCVPQETDDANIYAEYKPIVDSKFNPSNAFPAITGKQ